jgi:class 3 adenylate cyclase
MHSVRAARNTVAMTLVSKERAILFADVSGSTAFYETLGNKLGSKAVKACLSELREIVEKREGQVVKIIGDEIMAVFEKPETASAAARDMQLRVGAMEPVAGVKFAIRIGFHFGPVLEDKGDFLGESVNTAARLRSLAKGGQILTSGTTANKLSITQRIYLRDQDTVNLQGKHDAMHVYELLSGDTEEATHVTGLATSANVKATLTLEIGGRTLDFPEAKTVLTMGREKTCDIVVAEKTASRNHARIERSGLLFVLIDESTNGTYVQIEGDREVLLRRDRVMLRGRGKIAFGTSTAAAVEIMLFDCS